MNTIKPPQLKKGDTVAIVSPSWGGPSIFPHIYESGLNTLKELGLNIKEYPSARQNADFLASHPEFRAKDINDAFADTEVCAIIASIGGNDSVKILPFLNAEIIKNNPKIILGYSDTTTLLAYINQLGLVTYHGPAVMAGFSQWHDFDKLFSAHITTFLFENPKQYAYQPYHSYSNGYADWSNPANTGKTNERIENKGWNWLQGNGRAEGELFGGCIEVLEFIKGTEFWPNKQFWQNKILFLETSEEKPSVDQVTSILQEYGSQGIFDSITGLLIGRARDYSDEEKKELDEAILSVVKKEYNNTALPIVTNMDFGHTDPQWILPLGITAEIDYVNKSFHLLESPFA